MSHHPCLSCRHYVRGRCRSSDERHRDFSCAEPRLGRSDLLLWLRQQSTDASTANQAADEIEHLAAASEQHFTQAMTNGQRANQLREALALVMRYPDVRTYLGTDVSTVADAALNAAMSGGPPGPSAR